MLAAGRKSHSKNPTTFHTKPTKKNKAMIFQNIENQKTELEI